MGLVSKKHTYRTSIYVVNQNTIILMNSQRLQTKQNQPIQATPTEYKSRSHRPKLQDLKLLKVNLKILEMVAKIRAKIKTAKTRPKLKKQKVKMVKTVEKVLAKLKKLKAKMIETAGKVLAKLTNRREEVMEQKVPRIRE